MKLLKDVEDFIKKDDRNPAEQMSYIKQLGTMMMFSPRLHRDHVVAFCGSLLGMYENLNKDADEQEQLIKLEK